MGGAAIYEGAWGDSGGHLMMICTQIFFKYFELSRRGLERVALEAWKANTDLIET